MNRRTSLKRRGALLALFLMTTDQGYAQEFDVVTLKSPNEEFAGVFGISVSDAGDVNRDGYPDVIVGAQGESPGASPDRAGRAHVFGGQDGNLLFTLKSVNEEGNGEFGRSVSGAGDVNHDGFADVLVGARNRAQVFSGKTASLLFEFTSPAGNTGDSSFGWAVSAAGDVDQDGFGDLIVGAWSESPDSSPDNAGRAYVFSGLDGSLLLTFRSPNEQEQGSFGWDVSAAGDVNRDGFADVIVGAYNELGGRSYVFSGPGGSLLFELKSPNQGGTFGNTVSDAGDVNQDAFPDVIVGAYREFGTGRAYVFSGQDGSPIFELVSPNEESGGLFGGVAGAGDVNRDGFADVIVGALLEDPPGSPGNAGRAYIFGGPDGNLLFELASPNEEQSGNFGRVSGAGDFNQDGFADVLVGAWTEDPGGSPANAGRAYVFLSSGGQPKTFRINSGGPNYTDTNGNVFVADQAYASGSFGYVGGRARTFSNPIGGTDEDLLYQDLRLVREDGFFYRFDVSATSYEVTLHLMAPALGGAGNIVMDVVAEGLVVLDNLDVTAEAGGLFRALRKTFTVDVNDGRLDLRFVVVNKAAVVSAISVVQQTGALSRISDASADGPLAAEMRPD